MNYNLKINLSKLFKVKYLTKESEQYICIPVKSNFIFNGQKGFYLEMTAFEIKDKKFGESHMIKLNIPQETYNALSDEQKKKVPIIGSLKEFSFATEIEQLTSEVTFDATPKNVDTSEQDDLPF